MVASSEKQFARGGPPGEDSRRPLDPSLLQFVGYFLWLGAVGFGGPIALAGHMQQDLVDKRRWVSSEDYVEGLALAQLAPGPLAAQLAIYLGYVRAGVLGATLVGIAFVLPSLLNGSGSVVGLCAFRWVAVDAGDVLRGW